MSLYNMINGFNPLAKLCLDALKLKPESIERFRDAHFMMWADDLVICILTRTGGNNREAYSNAALTKHPNYLRDYDADFDDTYANYLFTLPDELRREIDREAHERDMSPAVFYTRLADNETVDEKMQRTIEALAQGLENDRGHTERGHREPTTNE